MANPNKNEHTFESQSTTSRDAKRIDDYSVLLSWLSLFDSGEIEEDDGEKRTHVNFLTKWKTSDPKLDSFKVVPIEWLCVYVMPAKVKLLNKFFANTMFYDWREVIPPMGHDSLYAKKREEFCYSSNATELNVDECMHEFNRMAILYDRLLDQYFSICTQLQKLTNIWAQHNRTPFQTANELDSYEITGNDTNDGVAIINELTNTICTEK